MKSTERKFKRFTAALAITAALFAAGNAMALKQAPANQIDINRAGVEELASVPGIGPSKAQAIVTYRNAAPFRSIDELINVKGIGEKLFAKISQYVTVNGIEASIPGTAEKKTQ